VTLRSRVRCLTGKDAGAYVELRRRALETDARAFASSVEDDPGLNIEFLENSLNEGLPGAPLTILGVFDPRLSGVLGLVREREIKARHKARLFGLYVAPEQRGGGLGQALLAAAYDRVRAMAGVEQIQVRVSTSSDVAIRLYEQFGFTVFGVERKALKIDHAYEDEILMVLDLSDDAA
jgi:ribosomal protein S18 acetylase RimI-like enzyme